jgi:hypothetical protein
MKIRIQHRTSYRYATPVRLGPHRVMVRPREGHDLHIESSILTIRPGHTVHWVRDVNGNSIALVDFTERSGELMIYSELVLNHYDSDPLDFRVEPYAVQYPFVYDPWTLPELTAFTHLVFPTDAERVREWLGQFWQPGKLVETVSLLKRLNQFIKETFTYRRRDESGVQRPAQTVDRVAISPPFSSRPAGVGVWRPALSAGTCSAKRLKPVAHRRMRGRRSTCPAPDGRGSILRAVRWRARSMSPSLSRVIRRPPHPFRVLSSEFRLLSCASMWM